MEKPLSATVPTVSDRQWLEQIFSARAVNGGGVVRRNVRDVELRIGRVTLELEVRRRGFHLVECGSQFVIFCDRGNIRLIC